MCEPKWTLKMLSSHLFHFLAPALWRSVSTLILYHQQVFMSWIML